jgi:histidinol-phosphate aminotransferase
VRERDRMRARLGKVAGVRRVDASQGNFLLVHFDNASEAYCRLLAHGVVVRDQRSAPGLRQALRITIGSATDNERVLSALAAPVPAGVEVGVAR